MNDEIYSKLLQYENPLINIRIAACNTKGKAYYWSLIYRVHYMDFLQANADFRTSGGSETYGTVSAEIQYDGIFEPFDYVVNYYYELRALDHQSTARAVALGKKITAPIRDTLLELNNKRATKENKNEI